MTTINSDYYNYYGLYGRSLPSPLPAAMASSNFAALLEGNLQQADSTDYNPYAKAALEAQDISGQVAYAALMSSSSAAASEQTESTEEQDAVVDETADSGQSSGQTAVTYDTTPVTTTAASEETQSHEEGEGEEAEETYFSASGVSGQHPLDDGGEFSGMQFWDVELNMWREDNIPHRINESGQLEYFANGSWQIDRAAHRFAGNGDGECLVPNSEESPWPEGWQPGQYSEGIQLAMEIRDPQTGEWSQDTYLHRISPQGFLQYYDNGEWLNDFFEHRNIGEQYAGIKTIDSQTEAA